MKQEFVAQHLNVAAFAHAAGTIRGEERLARFERLTEEARGMGGESFVTFAANGEIRLDGAGVNEVWLHLEAQATLALTCQRCLGPVDVPVEFIRDFRFVLTEELAEVEDEESEEDVLVLSRSFNLLELVEDELLLALPTAPKHITCPEVVKLHAADPDFVDTPSEKPNPFAVLEQLKRKS